MLMAALMVFSATVALAASTDDKAGFCWKDSYGRGVGKIPKTCPSGQQKIGLLCYDKCSAGMKRFGFDCHTACPSGFKSVLLMCVQNPPASYNRGKGYFSQTKCKKAYKTTCAKGPIKWFKKCKAGYAGAVRKCKKIVQKVNCSALKMNPIMGKRSCLKKIQLGKPRYGKCPSGQERQAGLCYNKCKKTGYKGVGPVCWSTPPKTGWVNCGMGAAKDKKTCAAVVGGQVFSVGMVAFNIATWGAASAGELAADASRFAKYKKNATDLYKEYELLVKAGLLAKAESGAIKTLVKSQKPEDVVRAVTMITSVFDPTGITGVVSAYSYGKCSKYFN